MANPLNKREPWYWGDRFHRYPRAVPLVASFTLVNTFATAQDRIGRLTLEISSLGSGSAGCVRLLMRPLQATPYTIDFCGVAHGDASGSTTCMTGIAIYDGTKVITSYGGGSNAAPGHRVLQWTNTTTASATAFSRAGYLGGGPVYWSRLTDDGTTRRYFGSANGKDWYQIASEATNTFLTPTQYGIVFFNSGSTVAKASIYHFSIQSGIIGDEP